MKKKLLLFFVLIIGLKIIAQPVVKKDVSKLYGIADKKTGGWLTKPIYDQIETEFFDKSNKKLRCFIAYKKDGMIIVIDKSGKKIISQKFESVYNIDKSLPFIVYDNKKWSFYAPETDVFKKIGWVDDYSFLFKTKISIVKLTKEGKFCIVDLNQIDTLKYLYDVNGGDSFRNGDTLQNYIVKQNNKFGTITFGGKQVIPCIYDSILKSYDRYNETRFYFIKKDDKWGICSIQNNVLITPKYQAVYVLNYTHNFNTPLLYLAVKQNNKWGIIDSVGNYIIKHNNDSILGFSDSDISVRRNGKMGILDYKENIIFPFMYDYAESTDIYFFKKKKQKTYLVNNGCKICDSDTTDGLWGLADAKGHLLEPVDANYIKLFRNYNYIKSDYEGYEDSTLIGYIWNRSGIKKQFIVGVNEFEETRFDTNNNEQSFIVYVNLYSYTIKGGKTGILSIDGEKIIPIKYDDLSFTLNDELPLKGVYISQPNRQLSNTYYVDDKDAIYYKLNSKYGVIDWKAQTIIPAVYDSVMYVENGVYEITDENDSLKNKNKISLINKVHLGYLSGNRYYYSNEGKQLGIIEKEVNELNYLNFFDINNKQPFLANYFIATKNAVIDTFIIHVTYEMQDDDGREHSAFYSKELQTTSKGNYNIIDPQTHNYILPNWADDIIFCPNNPNDSLRFNKSICNLSQQVDFLYSSTIDSIFDSKHKVYKIYSNNNSIPYIGTNFSPKDTKNIFCYKVNNQWFLFDVFTKKIINTNSGYDSIIFNGKNWVATKNKIEELYSVDGIKQN